jgi:hypothetical protein
MMIPVISGWFQLVLWLAVAVGVALLLSSIVGLTRGHTVRFIDENGRHVHLRRRQLGPKRVSGGLLLLIVALALLWVTSMAQSYLGLTADIPVAQIRATQIEGMPHVMSLELTQLDSSGHELSHKTYLVKGDRWLLQGNIVKFAPWMNMLGIHSGYKLTRLSGQYDDPNMDSNEKHTVIVLNGGDDDFFKRTYKAAWSSSFVDAAYGNAAIAPADGLPYNVFVSQTGFYPKPAK